MPSEMSVRQFGAPVLPPLRARLVNALVARALPADVALDAGVSPAPGCRLAVNSAAATPAGAPFEPAAALFIESGGALWKLEWSSLEALGLRPELRQWRQEQAVGQQDFALLPEGLRLAVLERLLAPELEALGRFLGCETRFVTYAAGEPAWSGPLPLTLDLPDGTPVFLRLFWVEESAARFVLERLETLPLRARPAWAGGCAVSCRLEVGSMRLTPGELASLVCGDVLLPERWTPDTPLLRPAGGVALVCRLAAGELTVVGPEPAVPDDSLPTSKPVEVSMSEPAAEHSETTDAGGQPLLDAAALGAMELPVTFELASLQLRVDELAALTPGYTLALGGDIASVPVSIRVGGRLLARGRLVDVGGMPGVQIEALEPAGDAGDTRPAEDAGAGEDAGLQEGNADGTGRD